MDRRQFIAATVSSLLASARAASANDDRSLSAVLAATLERVLDASPETATSLGLDSGARAPLRARLDEASYDHRLNLFQALADAKPMVSAIDRARLSGRDRAALDALGWTCDQAMAFRRFSYGGVGGFGYPVPYSVSQLVGAYQAVPDFLDSEHPIETRADCEAYLERLAAFPRIIAQETSRLQAEAATGAAPPGFVIDRTLAQLALLQAQQGAAAGLVVSLIRRAHAKQIGGDWESRAARIVDGPLRDALAQQAEALKSLRPKARAEPGVGVLPDGEAYYAMCLGFQTSLGVDPDEAHRTGLQQVAELSAKADTLLKAQGLSRGSVAERIAALSRDPAQLYPNTDEGRALLLRTLNDQIAEMRRRLPQAFGVLPKTPVEVRRVPVEIELGAPGGYSQAGSLDGSRPGAYYINLRDTALWPKWQLPTLTYHEALPGHHLQASVANEAQDTPTLMKILSFNAYAEGWALYAEQLADEMGLYEHDPLGRLGMLQASLFRACRVVVDTGLHARRWSREQAISYLVETAGSVPDDARGEVERYCVWPGQACGYKLGHLHFLKLRRRAQTALGARFDLRRFHDAVLVGGAAPLDVLTRIVDEWTAA